MPQSGSSSAGITRRIPKAAAISKTALQAMFLDDAGALLLETELGIGVLLDRDLSAVLERLTDVRGRTVERLLEGVAQGAEAQVMLQGKSAPIASIRAADVPRRFGFVARPAPRAGEPEC